MPPKPATLANPDPQASTSEDGDGRQAYKLGDDFAQLRQATIMMIDDEPITMEVVQTFLEDAGYRKFILEDDSVQAMERLREHRPDVLLLDVVMPEVSGFDILEMLRRDDEFSHLPVIILTSSSDAATKLQALDLGATDFLSKPVDPSELALRVRNTLAAKAYQDQLAYYDVLTNLPNRQLLQQRAEWLITRARQEDRGVALMHVTFDDLKRVTETFGPKIADDVLKQIALRLQSLLQGGESPERSEGDGHLSGEAFRLGMVDFCILWPSFGDISEVAIAGRRLLDQMRMPFDADGTEVYLPASVGVATFPDDDADVTQLVRLAVGASSQAAANGGDRLQFYSAEMNESSLQRLRLEADLRRAVEAREFRLLYQPKVEVDTGRIVGSEALVRWQVGDTFVSPADFIPIAEETGLILPIGEWVMEEACTQLARWRDAGIHTKVSVNISIRQFYESDLVGVVSAVLAKTGIDPRDLMLEVTESLVMGRMEEAEHTLRRLRQIGVRVAIDDFGTGYSSLSYLKHLPADELKIDRAFINDISNSHEDKALVAAVTYLAHKLGYSVCAEGVEEAAQLRYLQKIKCDEFQGYLCSKPVDPDEIANRLREQAAKVPSAT